MKVLITVLLIANFVSTHMRLAQGSNLPPSDPLSAFDFGTIDYVRPTYFSREKRMPCTRHQVVLKWDNPDINAAWIKFSVAGKGSRIFVKMTEDPPTTIWFELYDKNFQLVETYRGAAHEEINRIFEIGTYYIKVIVRSDVAHLPGGYNTGNILVRGFPPNIEYPVTQIGTITLPNLTAGSPISYNGTVLNIAARNNASASTPGRRDCELGSDGGLVRISQRFAIVNAPAGNLRVAAGVRFRENWAFNSGIFHWTVSGWQKVQNNTINHAGGPLTLSVGASPHDIHAAIEDAFLQFELEVAVASDGGNPGGPPSNVVVITHQQKDLAVGTTVPILPWLNVSGSWAQFRITQNGPVVHVGDWSDGYLTLDGNKFLRLPGPAAIILPPNRFPGTALVTPEELSRIVFHAGTPGIENLVSLHGFDGTNWTPVSAVVIRMVQNSGP